ncbi:hypothetical protein niasHT_026517 [Heterodera trifolii]|uniref:Uncharacterized protein n=1 Tax=Heterodera trifolii TaxID=157864 RepID=A0ABD2KS11_9BILA
MMENLLNYLRNQSPQISADAQRNSKELLANCVNQFLLLCESNAEFFENFRELSESRAIFKEILDFASKGMEEMLPNRLMDWFNDHNKKQKDLEDFDVGRSFADRIFEKSNIKKSYDECPKENMTTKELIRADQKAQSNDLEAYDLMTSYIDFLQTSADDRFHGTSVASIDLVAAIWHFRETIRDLFRFGYSLEDKSDKFNEILAKHKQFFEEDTSEIRDENRELCQLNKIGHKIVHLTELRDESKAWRERMERATKTNTGDMFEERFLFLPNGDEEIAIFGDAMDCQNAETLSRLKSQMFGVQRKKRIHFFCLNKLIKRFKRLQSFFCYGIGEFQPLFLKDNVRLLISEQALDALESKNPQILHYDILNMGIFTATFLAQLRHKSGSPVAECYEVRILLSSLMARINLLERSLYEYNDNLPASTRKACLEKIKKRTIFDIIIAAVKKAEVIRQFREIRGSYTRISRYLEDQRMFNKLLKEADFYEQRVFEKDRLMQAHYIEVLLCVDLAINGEGWLKADLMVFVRWMDSKKFTKDGQNELMANRIGKVWDNEIRPIFAKTYDSFYDLDDSPENHSFKIENLRKILSIFKNYLDKTINAKKAKSDRVVFAELAKIIGSGGDSLPSNGEETINGINGMPMALSETQEKAWHCFENWIQNLHFDMLKQMLNKRTIFFNNIKRFFESKLNEHTNKLMLFLHNKQNVENILRLLGIDFEANGSSDGSPSRQTPGAEDDDWPSTDSPMGSTASPVLSPSTERKKTKRKKAKRSKTQRKSSIVEHEIDEEMLFLSETPKKGTESQKKQSEEEEKPPEQEEDEAVIEAAEIKEIIGEKSSKDEAANGGKAQVEAEEKIKEEPTKERAPDEKEEDEEEEEEAVNQEKGPKEDEEEQIVETEELIREGPPKEEAVKGGKAPAKDEAKNEKEPIGSAPDEEEDEDEEEEAVKEALEGEKLTWDKKAPKDEVDIGEKAFEDEAIIMEELMEKVPLRDKAEKAENEKPEQILTIASVQKAEREVDVMEETINRDEEHIDNYQPKNHNWEDVQIGDNYGSEKVEGEKGNSMALSKSPQKGAKRQTKEAANANFEFCDEHFNAKNLDIAEIKGVTIDYFGDKEFLMIKYGELIWHFVCSQPTAKNNSKVIGQNKKVEKEQKPMPKESVTLPGEDAFVRAIVHLLDLGIYANEIWHRLNAIRLVEQIWPELGILQSEVAEIEGQWAKIKGIKLSLRSQWTELEKYLHQMLKQLLVLMDKKKFPGINYYAIANDNEKELLREIRLLKDEMHLRNLAFSLAESKSAQTIWHSLGATQTSSFLSLLFSHLFKMHLNQRVNFAIKENNQQKIVCHNQSLFCRLSKKENLLALQRIQKDYFNSVPQIHFTYKTLPVTILAILVPNLGQEVPNGPLDDQKIKTIAQRFGDEIEKLIRADHLFDEGQFRSSQKVNDQTMEQLANSIFSRR